MRNIWLKGFGTLLLLGVLIQAVPFGRDHTNPDVTGEPVWDNAHTRETFFRVCRDCHSNETVWPWYSNVAPLSWLIQWDVAEGREEFNVSEWGRWEENKGEDAAEEVRDGEMPPFQYVMVHPEVRLTQEERAQFVNGLRATFGDENEENKGKDP